MAEIWTFLFTDLEHSTQLWEQYPEAMQSALARHDAIITEAVEDANGTVVKTTGDGFLAVFSAAQDGVVASIHAQQRLLSESWGKTGPLRVRMGLHAGEVERRGGDYFGPTLNRAARLMSAASGGQVLLSAAVAGLVADSLPKSTTLLDLGEHKLKDLQQPEHIFQLVHPDLSAEFPPITSLNRLPNNLPSQSTLFVGRDKELDDIHKLFDEDDVRLLTLLGPGGTGKTRLALQAAADISDRFEDGLYFVDLSPIQDPDAVLPAIAREIGLSTPSDESMLSALADHLRDKNVMLLLDNFEQVTPAAVQVAELLRACPQLKLLVTSRESLRVRGEHILRVAPLGLPPEDLHGLPLPDLARYEAVQLFVDRAQAVRPEFQLTEENAAAVAEICLRLDGLPLAIELAAARTRTFSPQALLQRLASRLNLLRGGARDLPERQQTLRDTIDWSYDLLEPTEKTLFAVLSVFSGFTFDSAEAVAGAIDELADSDMDVADGLVSLNDKSLVRMSDDASGEPRFRMLETIREYATDRLRSDPSLQETACHAHAVYFAGFTQQQWQRMAGQEREAAMQALAADVDNLQIAWDHWVSTGNLQQLQRMVDGLWLLYDRRGWYLSSIELTSGLLDVLSSTETSPEQVRQEIMLQTSLARALLAAKGFTPEVEDAYQRALELSEASGEVPQLFPVLRGLSSYYTYRSEFVKSAQVGARIIELAESNDDDELRVHGDNIYGISIGMHGEYRKAVEVLDHGIALFEREQQTRLPFQLGTNPGIVCYAASAFFFSWAGFPDMARERMHSALVRSRELNHPFTLAYALFHSGLFALWQADMEPVQAHARELQQIAETHGFQLWEPLSQMLLGFQEVTSDQPEEGLTRMEQAFERYRGLKSPPVFYPQLIAMRASAHAQAGRTTDGLRLVDALLEEKGADEMMYAVPEVLMLKAELLVDESPDNADQAAGVLRRILDSTIQTEKRLIALQAATKLCALEVNNGLPVDDGPILTEIYASFTEGFDTVHLIEAKRILDLMSEAT